MYYLGLDLGQMQDYTALTVLQRIKPEPPPAQPEPAIRGRQSVGGPFATIRSAPRPVSAPTDGYHLRHVERLPLGTSYTAVAERVLAVQRSGPLASADTVVVADTTGVGLPVFEMLKGAGVTGLRGVTIHSGDAVSRDGAIHRVPKRDLVSTLQVLFQSGRLQIADGLAEGAILRHELQSFKAKINIATGHDSYEAWREGDHDDLVLSLAMACWYAETQRPTVHIPRPGTVRTNTISGVTRRY